MDENPYKAPVEFQFNEPNQNPPEKILATLFGALVGFVLLVLIGTMLAAIVQGLD